MLKVASLMADILLGFTSSFPFPETLDVFLSSSVNNSQCSFAAKLAKDELFLLMDANFLSVTGLLNVMNLTLLLL